MTSFMQLLHAACTPWPFGVTWSHPRSTLSIHRFAASTWTLKAAWACQMCFCCPVHWDRSSMRRPFFVGVAERVDMCPITTTPAESGHCWVIVGQCLRLNSRLHEHAQNRGPISYMLGPTLHVQLCTVAAITKACMGEACVNVPDAVQGLPV